ncbi:hypothetical protein JCM9957A_23550 [Kineosporia succinea]|uniref:Uncharacterized protein n=2 Tax=Kineosporia succinea TaxID=84632 RepID=A0ABT9PA66_9ACTN|nr:hypothetical protein [Kineosporia succinea]
MAHGISGPLALLSTAKLRGITVPGQDNAIHTICTWLDHWRQENDRAVWWPNFIELPQLEAHPSQVQPTPARPSWCYGAPGIARAHQLAGAALTDESRVHLAHRALLCVVADLRQRTLITEPNVCHGWAGVKATALACGDTAKELGLHHDAAALQQASSQLPTGPDSRHLLTGPWQRPTTRPKTRTAPGHQSGLLEGVAGSALADSTQHIRWGGCLLLERTTPRPEGGN